MMNQATILRWTIAGGSAAMLLIGAQGAMAQSMVFPPGTDCSLLPQGQQIDCHMQQQNSTMNPGGSPLPAENGTGTNQDGTVTPNGSSGQTNGSFGSGGASPPGQSGN
jgi:hypothetical protein